MSLEQRAQKLWPDHPQYQAAWIRIVTLIGAKWLLHDNPEPRPQTRS